MNGSNSPMTDGSSVTTPTSLSGGAGTTSPVLSPTNGMKKPKLRVQIPMEAKENSTLAGAIKEEESSELPPVCQICPRTSSSMLNTTSLLLITLGITYRHL